MATERTIVVTGAAGAIGRATVSRFLGRGFTVLGLDREQAKDLGARYHHVMVDLRDAEETPRRIDGALRDVPPVAHLIAIAGGALPEEPSTQSDIADLDASLFRASIDANLTIHFVTVHAVLPHLRRTTDEDRSIVLTSSFNGLSAQGMPAYSAAKAGLIGLMYGSLVPLGRLGIRINVIAPGTILTPRTQRLWAAVPEHFARLQASTVLGRLGQPDDVAVAFVALALDMRHVTGQVVVVDGGQTAASAGGGG